MRSGFALPPEVARTHGPGPRSVLESRSVRVNGGDTVKKATLSAVFAGACACASAWAQPPADCTPNALNIPGAPYPCVFPDNRVMFRVAAPDAQKVTVRLGRGLDMTKGPDGLWY